MNETRTRIAVGDIVVEKSKEGGSFYKCDDFIHLSAIEWKTLFSLNIIVEGEPKSFILDQDRPFSDNSKFVSVEFYKGETYVDIRRWTWLKLLYKDGTYIPSREGVQLRVSQWKEIEELFKNETKG